MSKSGLTTWARLGRDLGATWEVTESGRMTYALDVFERTDDLALKRRIMVDAGLPKTHALRCDPLFRLCVVSETI
jgi:hypothetical protein